MSDQYIKSQRKGDHGKPFSYRQLQSTALVTRLFDFMPTDISNDSSPGPSSGSVPLAGIPSVEHSRDNDSCSEHYHDYRSFCKRAGKAKSIRLTLFALLRPPPPNEHRCLRDRRLWQST